MAVEATRRRVVRPRSRRGRTVLGLGVVLVACCLVAVLFSRLHSPRADTPMRAVDLYVTAREHGDRGAMAEILDGNAGLRAAMLSEVDGRPVRVSAVSIARSDISDTLYDVTVTWTDGIRATASTDRLLVLPRPGDPSALTGPTDWFVSVAS